MTYAQTLGATPRIEDAALRRYLDRVKSAFDAIPDVDAGLKALDAKLTAAIAAALATKPATSPQQSTPPPVIPPMRSMPERLVVTTVAAVSQGQVLVQAADGDVVIADNTEVAHCGAVIGLAAESAGADADVAVITTGDYLDIADLDPALPVGSVLWVSDDGDLTDTPSLVAAAGVKWAQPVGIALPGNRVLVVLGEPLVLDETTLAGDERVVVLGENGQLRVAKLVVADVGDIKMAAGTPGERWLLCAGGAVATAAEPALFAAIGYTYGGAGATFLLPDFSNAVPYGNAPAARTGSNTRDIRHKHDKGTLAVDNHHHGAGTLAAAAHTHGAGSLAAPDHAHGAGTLAAAAHGHTANTTTVTQLQQQLVGGQTVNSFNSLNNSGPHAVSGSTGSAGAGAVAGSTASSGPHAVSGNTADATATISGETDAAKYDIAAIPDPALFDIRMQRTGVAFYIYAGPAP